jgi:serine/threonine protein kinase
MAIPQNNPNSKPDSEHTPPNRGLNSNLNSNLSSNQNNGQNSGQSSETGPIAPSYKPGLSETWSTMHMLALDSTKLSGQAQTASLPMGRGMTKVYSTGDIVDNSYRLLSLLGTGGMGVVFHCQHLILGKEYALKLLAADKLSAESWSRFQSEAKALARLHHPGVVGIHNMGIDAQECPYYVMDLLEGQSLSQIVNDNRRLPVARALPIFIQLADALDSAHQQGIIHRDIKPSNVMVLQEKNGDKVKLVDFGIARLSNRGVGSAFDSQNKTAAGTVFGTPYYMSPEQSLGKPVDHRSDIYSLGCALFEALTGLPPFCGNNAFETILMHQTNEAPSLNSVYPQGKFSSSLETAVAKMLKKDVEERYQSMKQVAHDLSRIQEGKSIGITKKTNSDFDNGQLNATDQDGLDRKPSAHFISVEALIAIALLVITASAIAIWTIGYIKSRDTASVADSSQASNDLRFEGTSDTGELKRHMKENATFVTLGKNSQGQPVKIFNFPRFYLGYMQYGNNEPQRAENRKLVPINEKSIFSFNVSALAFLKSLINSATMT